MKSKCRVLVTGANGFIGKNLVARLRELPEFEVAGFVRDDGVGELVGRVERADAVVHLAGENRPRDVSEFHNVNVGLTAMVVDAIRHCTRLGDRVIPLVFTSSIQAEKDNPYGNSKRDAERIVEDFSSESDAPVVVYRLPGVFGKWGRPHYNSVVATFCHDLCRGLPIQVNNPQSELALVYVDDVVESIIGELRDVRPGFRRAEVLPVYALTVGELAGYLTTINECHGGLSVERVGSGLMRALYSTFISYLPASRFSYAVPLHEDPRGVFVEMLKTKDSGQFSFFTAHPGVTRGGHYHHSKTEKFLVIKGQALFRFRSLLSNDIVEIATSGQSPRVVDTIPGWVHDITNVGQDELVVMLWANEVFDRERPDTVAGRV